MQKYFTTPIYYVNDVPHIGHAYCTLATDTITRYWRHKLGEDQVFFCTGTDENSQKTVEAAQKAGLPVNEYLNNMAQQWQQCWDTIGVSYNNFIRTTENRHQQTVQDFLQKLVNSGDVYKGTYEGLYCTGCESFKKESDLDENDHCPDHKKPCQEVSEENYFFRLSKFTQPLLELYKTEPERLQPSNRRNEIVSFLEEGLEDISISRESAEIGISLPHDPDHKIYVWIDALINYYTVAQASDNPDMWNQAFHIVGKDITRFHCVIWPAMLMAAGIQIPTGVFGHGFFTIDGQKMSKSLGNVVAPTQLSEKYGNDALRIGLLSSFEFGNDGDFSLSQFDQFYQTKLAGGVGNLFNRVIVLLHKFYDGAKPDSDPNNIDSFYQRFDKALETYKLKAATDIYFEAVAQANQLMNETEPWKLTKTDPDAAKAVFGKLLPYLEFLTEKAVVILPESATKMQAMLGNQNHVGKAIILFERV